MIKKIDFHSLFYFISCNNEQSEFAMKNFFKKSGNIKDMIDNIKTDFHNYKEINNNLNKIFLK